MKRSLLLFFVFTIVQSYPSITNKEPSILQLIGECFRSGDSLLCLKERAVKTLDKAVKSDQSINIGGFVDIVKDDNYQPKHDDANDTEILSNNSQEKSNKLDELLSTKIDQFLESRSLKFSLGDIVEGRKKKDKGGAMALMAGLAMAGMMGKLMMGKIAFLAGAALLTAKIALVISVIIGLKKLVGGGGGGGSEHVVVQSGGDHGGGWHRSLDGDVIAYRAYRSPNAVAK